MQLDKYTTDVATDGGGNVLEGAEDWSLKCLMASCFDFAKERTASHVGSQLGVSIIITPKFHAKLPGEGVENSVGIANGMYRRKQLISNKAKQRSRS